jgi:phosphoribosylformylglycinamidine cyclo-ligase
MTYAAAGVDIERAESFVARLKQRSRRQGHGQLWKAAGGYACVYPMSAEQAVAVTTDGVGTKLLVADELGKHSTIGIDLVAMCANDLICVGATPNIFLDYFAVGRLEDKLADEVIEGIIEGCDRAGMILAGGETAEMPGLYQPGHYDLGGFAVGQVTRQTLISGEKIRPGQTLIGVASNGIHSNGLSLARKVLASDKKMYSRLLEPTHIYVKPVVELLANSATRDTICGIAHITGGGWRNIFRLNPEVGYLVEDPLPVPDVLLAIAREVELDEMYRTFNMGVGLMMIADGSSENIIETFKHHGFVAQVIGSVTDKLRSLDLPACKLTITDE